MRYHILEIEPLELSVGKMQPHLFAQLPLRADAAPVADDKHSDQQFRINRRATNVAVEPTQLFVVIAECRRHENINPAQKAILWHHVIEPELVEQARLLSMLSPHHAESSCAHTSSRNHFSAANSKLFSTASVKLGLSLSQAARQPHPHQQTLRESSRRTRPMVSRGDSWRESATAGSCRRRGRVKVTMVD
jgi:hypothetical protein